MDGTQGSGVPGFRVEGMPQPPKPPENVTLEEFQEIFPDEYDDDELPIGKKPPGYQSDTVDPKRVSRARMLTLLGILAAIATGLTFCASQPIADKPAAIPDLNSANPAAVPTSTPTPTPTETTSPQATPTMPPTIIDPQLVRDRNAKLVEAIRESLLVSRETNRARRTYLLTNKPEQPTQLRELGRQVDMQLDRISQGVKLSGKPGEVDTARVISGDALAILLSLLKTWIQDGTITPEEIQTWKADPMLAALVDEVLSGTDAQVISSATLNKKMAELQRLSAGVYAQSAEEEARQAAMERQARLDAMKNQSASTTTTATTPGTPPSSGGTLPMSLP